MAYYTLSLQAGIPYTHNVAGKLILLDRTGAADGIDIATIRNGTPQTTMPGRKAAFRLVESYDGVTLTAPVDAVVGIFLSFEDVQLGVADGAAVKVPDGVTITNDAPIPVLFGGTVAPVLGVVTVDNNNSEAIPVDQKAGAVFTVRQDGEAAVRQYLCTAVANPEPVIVTDTVSVLLVANALRRGVRFRNAGETAVAIGGAGISFAVASVVIQQGETWNENEAPGAAWYCICEAGLTSKINIQTIA